MANQLSPDFEAQHDKWAAKNQPLMKLITPAALNSKYNELHSIIREDLIHS